MSVRVIVQTNPFSLDRKDLIISPCKINEIIRKIDPSGVIDSGWRIMVNDEIITDFEKSVKDNDTVYIKVVPEGSNKNAGKGMSWAGAAMIVGGALLMATGVGFGAGIALMGAGVGCLVGGVALYNIDIPEIPKSRETSEQDPSLRGSRNQMRHYGYVPALFGKRRIYADLGSQYYTWVEGGKQYLYELFCAGQANQQIDTSTIKIADTLLTEYSITKDMSKILSGQDGLVHLSIAYGQSVPPLLTKCVHESQHNSVLKHLTDDNQDASFVETTVDGTEEIHVDIFFPNGLGKYDSHNNLVSASVKITAQYKPDGEPDSAYQSLGHFSGNTDVISGSELKTKRFSIHKTGLTAGKYTVRITRVTADSSDNKTVDKCYVGSLRSIRNEQPIQAAKCQFLTLIGLKLGVSEKLNGLVDQLNFESTSILPVPSGEGLSASDWTQEATSSNPASCAIWAMKGDMAQQKLGNNEIDWFAFKKLYDWCSLHQYECNAYLSESMPLQQLLSAIASTCRSEIFRFNGKITVVQDIERSSFVQIFTPRNSWDYEETISFSKIPDALAIGFNNKDKGYADDELKLYNTQNWQKESEPDEVTNVSTWGVTNSRQAQMIGIYKYAVTKNRPFIATFKCDIEYMLCRKGDWIKYAGDVAFAGITQGRISSVVTSNNQIIGIESDEKLPMESGNRYALRIRRNDATFVLKEIQVTAGSPHSAEFLTPLELGEIQEENLFVFGELDNDSVDLVIMDITCEEGLTASITAVSYAPEIFNLDAPDYVLPPFTSKLSAVSGIIDSGEIQVNKWQTFYTYNDSALTPETPTGDGTSGTWHRTPTLQSRWVSYKIAKDINSGSWSAPELTTDEQLQQIINGNTESVGNPDDVTGLTAKATKDGLQIDWNANGAGLKNVIDRYIIEISLDDGESYGIQLLSKNNSLFYTFPANAFYEKDDFLTWYVRIKAVNAYSGESANWTETGVSTSGYGTWEVQAPTVYTRISGRFITLIMSQPARSDNKTVYGNIRYRVQVQRLSSPSDTQFYKPATSLNPYPTYQGGNAYPSYEGDYIISGNEDNYKDGEGFVYSDGTYIQCMPLLGQSTNDIALNTLYRFNLVAENEAGTSAAGTQIDAAAICDSIRDIVKANETAKKAFVSELSAISANLGVIKQGGLSGNDNNYWALSTILDELGVLRYEGEFRVGNAEKYLKVQAIAWDEQGNPTNYALTLATDNFEVLTESTNFNKEVIIYSNESKLDRIRITPDTVYIEHRETENGSWAVKGFFNPSGVNTPTYHADKQILIGNYQQEQLRQNKHDIGRQYLTSGAKVWHFDNKDDGEYPKSQNGITDGLTITSAQHDVKYGGGKNAVAGLDLTPAILAVAPYCTTALCLYGQYKANYTAENKQILTIDFWLQYLYAEAQVLFDIGTIDDKLKLEVLPAEPVAVVSGVVTWRAPNIGVVYTANRTPKLGDYVYNTYSEAEAGGESSLIISNLTKNADYSVASITVSANVYDFDSGSADMNWETFAPESEWGSTSAVAVRASNKKTILTHQGQTQQEVVYLADDMGVSFNEYKWYHIGIVFTEFRIKFLINDKSYHTDGATAIPDAGESDPSVSYEGFVRYATTASDIDVSLNEEETSVILDELYIDEAKELSVDFKEQTFNRIPWAALSKDENDWFIFDAKDPSKVKSNILEYFKSQLLASDEFRDRVLEIVQ